MFRANNIAKSIDKSKYVHGGYRIPFDGESSCSFGNDLARIVITFDVDNSSSSHAYTYIYQVLSEGPIANIIGIIGVEEKKFSINFSKAIEHFA